MKLCVLNTETIVYPSFYFYQEDMCFHRRTLEDSSPKKLPIHRGKPSRYSQV